MSPGAADLVRVGFDRLDLHLDVVIPGAQFVALVGPNGAGKTTVLRCLAGLESDASVDWTRPIGSVGYLPQRVSLYPAMTLQENVASSLRFAGCAKHDAMRAALHMLAVVDVEDLAGRRPHQVSGGQRQRAGLARAMAATPDLLLLDEPFAAIDAASRAIVRQRVVDHIRQSGSVCVLATHDESDVAASTSVSVELL